MLALFGIRKSQIIQKKGLSKEDVTLRIQWFSSDEILFGSEVKLWRDNSNANRQQPQSTFAGMNSSLHSFWQSIIFWHKYIKQYASSPWKETSETGTQISNTPRLDGACWCRVVPEGGSKLRTSCQRFYLSQVGRIRCLLRARWARFFHGCFSPLRRSLSLSFASSSALWSWNKKLLWLCRLSERFSVLIAEC